MKDNSWLIFWLVITASMMTSRHSVPSGPIAIPEYPSWSIVNSIDPETLEEMMVRKDDKITD